MTAVYHNTRSGSNNNNGNLLCLFRIMIMKIINWGEFFKAYLKIGRGHDIY